MSSSFWFLIDIEGLDESSSDAEFRHHGYDMLLGCEDGYDENQDRDVWALLLPSGRLVLGLTPPNHVVQQLQSAPTSDRWELAIQLATQTAAAACEASLDTTGSAMTKQLLSQLPRLLADSYAELAEGEPHAQDPVVAGLRQRRFRLCEGLYETVREGGLLPFIEPTASDKGIQALDRRCQRRSTIENTALVYAEIHP